jgi:hypothetical protein
LAYARDELFDLLLNCLKEGAPYILELTERIQSGLNLFIYLSLKEKAQLKAQTLLEPIITDKKYRSEMIEKGYFEALAHTI